MACSRERKGPTSPAPTVMLRTTPASAGAHQPVEVKRRAPATASVRRQEAPVDRIACPWLITHFVDPDAEFLYLPPDQVHEVAKRKDAIPHDAAGVELTHYRENGDERVSLDAIIKKYRLQDPAVLD